MSKRKQNELLILISYIPWYFILAMSGVVFFVCKYRLVEWVDSRSVFYPLASILSVNATALALVILIALPFSMIRKCRQKRILNRTKTLSDIERLSWFEFEKLVSAAYAAQGYIASENLGAGADGGVDVALRKGKKRTLVQCKHFRTSHVGVKVVREMFGIMHAEEYDNVIIVGTKGFTKESITFAKGKPIELLDGNQLLRLIGKSKVAVNPIEYKEGDSCPRCENKLVARTATIGKYEFIGCTGFPKCRFKQ